MKNIVFILLMMCFAFAGNAKVIVKGTLVNDKPATKEIHLLEHDGIALTKIETVPLQENAGNVTFQFELENIEIGFYFIGIDPNNVKYLILGPENEVVITGNCSNLSSAIVTSPLNTEFINIYRQVQGIDGRFNKEVNAIRNARGNATLIQKAEAEMAKIDADRKKLLNETTVKNAFLGNFVGLYIYYSY